MGNSFTEIVVDCPFILMKGFLMGFMSGKKVKPVYFFSRKEGIRTETLAEHFREWLGMENHVHLVIESEFCDELEEAIAENYEKIKVAVISSMKIESACFEFSAGLYDTMLLKAFMEDLDKILKDNVEYELKESEVVNPGWQDVGAGAVNMIPPHRHVVDGKVKGAFDKVIAAYNTVKQSPLTTVSEVHLKFDETECM